MKTGDIENLKQLANELSKSYCIIDGKLNKLDEIEQLGYNKFSLQSKFNMPLKLYKYFPNICVNEKVNFSIEALKNNTVFMQTPNNFDDAYDSDINMDYCEYERYRLIEYCRRSNVKINENFSTEEIGNFFVQSLIKVYEKTQDFSSIFKNENLTELEKTSNKLFVFKIMNQLNESNDLTRAVASAIRSDFEQYSLDLKTTFRISCFTTPLFHN